MGYLHDGHMALVRQARQECASVVASIYVNPSQFGPKEDLAAYPRDLARDEAQLEGEGVDLLWTPSNEIMYPEGYQTWVNVDEISRPLEGAMRPGHFRGVATIVAKLFNAVQPQKAYFGQKDAQQLAVIRQMTVDLNFPVEIVACPTVRETDGLAMSSRNSYLNPEEREAAVVLYQALQSAKKIFNQGERQASGLRQAMLETLAGEGLAQVQYVSVADAQTLVEIEGEVTSALCSLAVYIGKTRLIDNILLSD
jgi:pantoate--beta-alanine ligase